MLTGEMPEVGGQKRKKPAGKRRFSLIFLEIGRAGRKSHIYKFDEKKLQILWYIQPVWERLILENDGSVEKEELTLEKFEGAKELLSGYGRSV